MMNEYFVRVEQREKRQVIVKVKATNAPDAKQAAEHKAARIQGLRGKVLQVDFGPVLERSYHAIQVSGTESFDSAEYAHAIGEAVKAVLPENLPPGVRVVIEGGQVNVRLND